MKTAKAFSRKDFAVVYIWWTGAKDLKVVTDLTNPILYSISTLRRYEPDLPIYVIEYSPDPADWQDFPDRFKFEVIRQRCGLSEIAFRYNKTPHVGMTDKNDRILMENLSRPIDVWNFAHRTKENQFLYCDSDVFWNGSCFPKTLDPDYFHCRPDNSGVFFFDKESSHSSCLFNVWMGLSMLAAKNRKFRQRLYADLPHYTAIMDEIVYRHIVKTMPEFTEKHVLPLERLWNFTPKEVLGDASDIESCRTFHAMEGTYGTVRGMVAWLLREFYPAITDSFTPQEIETVFSDSILVGGKFGLDSFRDGIPKLTEKAVCEIAEMREILKLQPRTSDVPTT